MDRSVAGARPLGNKKTRRTIEDRERGGCGSLDLDDAQTALLSYSQDFDPFAGWDARLYRILAFSAHVQVRGICSPRRRGSGWAVAPPRRNAPRLPVRHPCGPGNILRLLRLPRPANGEGFVGEWREGFLPAHSLNTAGDRLAQTDAAVHGYVDRSRNPMTIQGAWSQGRCGRAARKSILRRPPAELTQGDASTRWSQLAVCAVPFDDSTSGRPANLPQAATRLAEPSQECEDRF